MTQKDIFDYEQGIKSFKEAYLKEKKEAFIGKNFLDALSDIAKSENTISVLRGNITFISHYPKRTKRPKIEISKDCFITNKIDLPTTKKDNWWYERYNATIKDIRLSTVVSRNPNFLKENEYITCIVGLEFVLDDSEEFIIEE